jgi:D-glycero-D-manno-heptose 1,7-bisphosphate phosphatase
LKNKAAFFDRDGVILNDTGLYYIYKPEDVKINPGIIESLKKLSDNGYLLIVISNQGGIGKGIYGKKETDRVHQILDETFKTHGIIISEYYYCPHHTDTGKCLCRKPDSLMVEKAIARFSIDRSKSILIGDSERDIVAAQKAGIRGVKIEPNQDIRPVLRQI